ncbi:MAG TPA: FecR family protein [Prolixibacteraceae bacterium]|nr:FecR family protein [Prolixibacteraceae bacterium]
MKSTIKKYLSGKSSENEQKNLLDWMRKDHNLTEFQSVKNEWKNEIQDQEIQAEFRQEWNNIQDKLFVQMQANLQRNQRTLNFFRYAAIFIFLIVLPSLFYFFSQSKLPRQQLVYTTVSADFGQISKVVLPDSSVIWVNSGSSIRYNNQFSAANRDIELTGEAFFKVHKNKNLPLIVSNSDLRVKVLGTEFSVSAYPEESTIQVVLEKGKVELTSTSHSTFRQEMKPGELACFNKKKKELAISSVNTLLYTSWKDGIINIYNLPLSEVVIKLEKRYNQQFVVDDAIKNLPYTFTIKNEKLSDILSLMEQITPVDAIQQGNVIELRHNKSKIKIR